MALQTKRLTCPLIPALMAIAKESLGPLWWVQVALVPCRDCAARSVHERMLGCPRRALDPFLGCEETMTREAQFDDR